MTLGAVLGTGVLSLPGLAAQVAGPASLLSWLAMVLISIPLAVTFGGLGARYPDGGGVAHYARVALGERASTVVGWIFYLSVSAGAPVAAGFAGAYVADLVGGGRGTQLLATAVLIVAVTALNWAGVQVSAGVQLAIAGTLAALLAIATVVALPHVQWQHLTPFAPHGWLAVVSAASLLIWAFAGWEVVTSLSAEYRHPRRDIPRATTIVLILIAVLYLGVAYVTVAALGPNPGVTPLSDLLVFGFGPAARPITTVLAVLLTIGTMNSYFAGISRLGASLGRNGSFPAWFGKGGAPGEVPRRSGAVLCALGLSVLVGLAVAGQPTETALLFVTGGISLVYVIGSLAALRLLPRGTVFWWAAVASLLATTVLLVFTGWPLVVTAAMAVAALLWDRFAPRRATVDGIADSSAAHPDPISPSGAGDLDRPRR